ncbi:MAG: hypothetical protein HUK19_00855 [Fibrobacter sp.]|nr:hypothetical protein [Fibrobacter sp.]
MKKFFGILGAVAALAMMTACDEQKKDSQVPADAQVGLQKNAVIYFSQTGTTKKVAEEFARQLGAETIELKKVDPYPSTYDSTIAAVRAERESKNWPALANAKLDLSKYDTLYVGAPIMFGFYAPPMYTFLDSNDLSGKVVVPFCTYGSGGRLASAKELASMEPDAHVVLSYGISNRRANNPDVNLTEEIEKHIAAVRAGASERQMVGAYGESRLPTEEDLAVFAEATKDYAYLNLTPLTVSSQVVAGMNYIFQCHMKAFGEELAASVKIFKPLPGRGPAQLISVDK